MFGLNIFRKKKNKKKDKLRNIRDSADLTTNIIVISGLAVASVVTIGGVAYASKDSGRVSANCIANHSTFNSNSVKECQQKGEESNTGSIGSGGGNPVPGEELEEKPDTPATDDTCFELNAQGDTITDYKIELEECTTDVVIPSSVNGTFITTIGRDAFYSNQLTSVSIPNSVRNINSSAFRNNQLTSVSIPDSVTSIGGYAFERNPLTSIVIPDSVTSIGDFAFSMNGLTSVIIPDSVTSISKGAFYYNKLTSVIIPDTVTTIGDSAFYHNQLTSVTIPNSVNSIGYTAFRENQLTSVSIPDSVTSIGHHAFGANPLTSASVPSHLTLSSGTFPNSTNITVRP